MTLSCIYPRDYLTYLYHQHALYITTDEDGNKTHHLVLQLPGIPRNHIRISLQGSVLSFAATIPRGVDTLASKNIKATPIRTRATTSANTKPTTVLSGQLKLAFPLPRGCVQTVQEMKFFPPAQDYKGLLTVSIPSMIETEFLDNEM